LRHAAFRDTLHVTKTVIIGTFTPASGRFMDTHIVETPAARAVSGMKPDWDLIHYIRAHIERKFADVEVELLPYPHIIMADFFPADVYEKIIDLNLFHDNRGAEWFTKEQLTRGNKREISPYDHRLQINFHVGHKYEATPETKQFWRSVSDVFLADQWFTKLIYSKFPAYFLLRYGELVNQPNFFDMFRRENFLQRHEPGYYIGPHTDIPTRVFTCLFTFADKPGSEEAGTLLLRHKDPNVRCEGVQHYTNWEDFEVVKEAPYRPNGFMLFFKTPQSWHAVRKITEDCTNQRFGMQFQFYEPRQLFRYLTRDEARGRGVLPPTAATEPAAAAAE
jgi:hypothetical protein